MQPKIVNYKVNQHLYSLRLLLSSISFLSFFPSSLSSSQGKAYLYIFTLLPVSLLIPSCITSLPSGIFSVSFKSFLRIIIIIFFIKVCFEWKAYPPPHPRVFLKNSFVENTIVHWAIERHFSPDLKGFHYFIISCVVLNISAESLVFVPLQESFLSFSRRLGSVYFATMFLVVCNRAPEGSS